MQSLSFQECVHRRICASMNNFMEEEWQATITSFWREGQKTQAKSNVQGLCYCSHQFSLSLDLVLPLKFS